MNGIKRIAIFASYSRDNKIHDYVIYYLRELKIVVDAIVFVADNDIVPTELAKLKGIVVHALCEKHSCYDFGSYKRGYHWVEENALLNDTEELIFCNDSCYGPVFPFKEVFSVMHDCDEDFWGMAHSTEVKEHLQSYFLLFKKNVFTSNIFKTFVNSFTKQDSLIEYVLKYELNFTEVLNNAGFRHTSYLKKQHYVEVKNIIKDNPTKYPITLLHAHMPLIKRKSYFIDFSAQLKESLEELHSIISKTNTTLYSVLCNDIRDYYTTWNSDRNKEWLIIALQNAEINNVTQTLAYIAEKKFTLVDEMRWKAITEQKDSNVIDKSKDINGKNIIIMLLITLCIIQTTLLICLYL